MPIVFLLHENGNNFTLHDLFIDHSSCWECDTNIHNIIFVFSHTI